MKNSKYFAALLCLVLPILGLTACTAAEAAADTGSEAEAITQELSVSSSHAEQTPVPKTETKAGNVLVVYFSCTGTTKAVAENAAEALGADLYEIVPETPYEPADLDYGDDNSRTSQEQNDDGARPAIRGSVENMGDYDTILLGYPIWWGQAPRIISTFLESYDLSGKTIVPFCTSGSSGIGSSDTNLHALAAEAHWMPGKRFEAGASRSLVGEWIAATSLQ